jgi:hypothetical protein
MTVPLFATRTAMLLAFVACGPPQGDPEPPPLTDTPSDSNLGVQERQKIGNLMGLGHRSRITFISYPDQPHQLELSFAFPDRARSLLRPDGGRSAHPTWEEGEPRALRGTRRCGRHGVRITARSLPMAARL